ncbi:hypothetical protein QYF61_012315 [Mycteria americana]|uniref:Phosducin domain-containing protein n=1 Tax=Mycteria americana TaxID=33587 RepID=A0AAN7N5I4_MYCAM|nr:hypothetical protein QYF61_012315 [Mycteria americana]
MESGLASSSASSLSPLGWIPSGSTDFTPMCLLVNEHLSLLARKFPEVKFLKATVNSCIQNYYDRYLPTILVYKTGEIKGRFIGVAECGGIYLKVEELEWKLAEVGAIETDLEENPKKDITSMVALSVQNVSAHEDTNTKSSDRASEMLLIPLRE